jgi:hypothetical protein
MTNKVTILDFLQYIDFQNANENMFGFELISLDECKAAICKFKQYKKVNNPNNVLSIKIWDPMSYYVNICTVEDNTMKRLNQLIIVPDNIVYETQIAIAAKLIVYVQSGQNCHLDTCSMPFLLEKAKLNNVYVERTFMQRLAKRFQPGESFIPWPNTEDHWPELHVANQNEFNLVKWTHRNDKLYHRYYWNSQRETHYFEFGDHEIKSELLKVKYHRDKESKSVYCWKRKHYGKKQSKKIMEVDDYLFDVKHGFA